MDMSFLFSNLGMSPTLTGYEMPEKSSFSMCRRYFITRAIVMDSLSLGNKQLIPTTWRIFDRYSERRQLLFCWHVLLEVVNNWSLLSDCIARYGLPLPEPCTVPSYCLLFGIQWKSWTCSWCSPSERAQYFRCLPLYDKVHGNEVCSFNLISFGFYESHL